MISKAQELGRIVLRLGLGNIVRVARYRMRIRRGAYKSRLPIRTFVASPLFLFDKVDAAPALPGSLNRSGVVETAYRIAGGSFPLFADYSSPEAEQIDWFRDYVNDSSLLDTHRHWSEIADFGEAELDIKCVWEMSRFAWLLTLARAYRINGDSRYSTAISSFVDQWRIDNPANQGPNWKCGQEASIRLLHVLMCAYVLGEDESPTPALIEWVSVHCERIATTTDYAVGQDNNHIVSEAAALFIAGSWLHSHGEHLGSTWAVAGRRLLERSILRLIGEGGDFAQYSTVYHRLMLDTLSLTEFWRRRLRAPDFSVEFKDRAAKATKWLATLCDAKTGDVPNLGANDGAHEYCLHSLHFRDFRPTVQLAAALFGSECSLPPGPWDEGLEWLGLTATPVAEVAQATTIVESESFSIARSSELESLVVIRQPKYRFRPSHADALHLDYTCRGENVLRDSGTFSYAVNAERFLELAGTAAHNTVTFDDKDQMPRIGRFLFGRWLKAAGGEFTREKNGLQWQGGYTDWRGNTHKRLVSVSAHELVVIDEVAPRDGKATLRWRLPSGDWRLGGNSVESGALRISLDSDAVLEPVLTSGIESRHYLMTSEVTVLEVSLGLAPVTVKTVISFLG